MGRNGSPPLLIAVNGLDGNAKKLRHLPLCFPQFISELLEFFAGHARPLMSNHNVVINIMAMWDFLSSLFLRWPSSYPAQRIAISRIKKGNCSLPETDQLFLIRHRRLTW